VIIVPPLKHKTNTVPVGIKSKKKHRRIDGALKSDNVVRRKITHSEIARVGKYYIIVSIKNNLFCICINRS